MAIERRQTDDKLADLRAKLDRESAARRGQEGDLDRLWRELVKEMSKLEKDSKLQAASKALGSASQLAEERKA